MSKALIVYGTRYGATAITTEVIADTLRQIGFEAKIVVAKKEKAGVYDLRDLEAIRNWTREVAKQ